MIDKETKQIKVALRDYFKVTLKDNERLVRLINTANYDLYYGPISIGNPDGDDFEYPGFTKALDEIEKGYYLNDKVIRYAKVIVGA